MPLSGSILAGTGYPSSAPATLRARAGPRAGAPSSTAFRFSAHCKHLIASSGPFNRSWERRWKRILKPYGCPPHDIYRLRHPTSAHSPPPSPPPPHPAAARASRLQIPLAAPLRRATINPAGGWSAAAADWIHLPPSAPTPAVLPLTLKASMRIPLAAAALRATAALLAAAARKARAYLCLLWNRS
jgi:hypothetical protein